MVKGFCVHSSESNHDIRITSIYNQVFGRSRQRFHVVALFRDIPSNQGVSVLGERNSLPGGLIWAFDA